jgi:hypothetical protein
MSIRPIFEDNTDKIDITEREWKCLIFQRLPAFSASLKRWAEKESGGFEDQGHHQMCKHSQGR